MKDTSSIAFKGIIKIVIIILLIIVLIRLTTYVYDLSYAVFNDKPNISKEKREFSIEIKPGMSVGDITDQLYANGIIQDKIVFKIQAKLGKLGKIMKIGTHKVDSFMNSEEIIESLSTQGVQ